MALFYNIIFHFNKLIVQYTHIHTNIQSTQTLCIHVIYTFKPFYVDVCMLLHVTLIYQHLKYKNKTDMKLIISYKQLHYVLTFMQKTDNFFRLRNLNSFPYHTKLLFKNYCCITFIQLNIMKLIFYIQHKYYLILSINTIKINMLIKN